ncbi:MAG: hypothetical protein EA426_06375 [Spirochaetaceae bacterium]|nr:MAG: hypothetical protein EA426_06375 [Spirochaetaceae bacterium]
MDTEPIEEIVERESDHTKTVRYAPVGDPKSWYTGEPYISFSLIPSGSSYIGLRVKWILPSQEASTVTPDYDGAGFLPSSVLEFVAF